MKIEQTEDAFRLSQTEFAEKVQEVNIKGKSKRQPDEDLREDEKSRLRTLCGDGMWLASQTMPQISAWVADLQAKIPQGKVRLIHEANHLVKLIRQNAHKGLRIFAHPEGVSLYMWTDAAWASRPDGFRREGTSS